MCKPLISVIVAVYKVEPYLERCVQSIRNQTYQNLEIILVDDGSPDRCGAMCSQFAQEDSRIRVIHQKNGGASSARNRGLDIATGELIGFVDSDDYIAPEMYEYLYGLMQEHQAQIACCGTAYVDDKGGVNTSGRENVFVLDRKQALMMLPCGNKIGGSVWNKLYRADIFASNRFVEGMASEDIEIMHRCIDCVECVAYSGRPLYYYYFRQDSISHASLDVKRFYDRLNSGRMRVEWYEQHCPDLAMQARRGNLTVMLGALYLSRKSKECRKMRDNLQKDVKELLRKYPELLSTKELLGKYPEVPSTKKLKIRVLCFKLGLPVYDLTSSIYHWLKNPKIFWGKSKYLDN